MMRKPILIGEVVEKDKMLCLRTPDGKTWYPLDGNSGIAEDFREAFGDVQRIDIGKRVYSSRGVWQMENDAQRQARLVGEGEAMTNAEHILQWCENSQEHWRQLRGLSKFPREGNFTTSAALKAYQLAADVYRAMKRDREDFAPSDILQAALLMLDWQGKEDAARPA